MGKFQDLTGETFGRLTVIGLDHKEPRKLGGYNYFYKCRCICGEEVTVAACHLKSEHTKSCGCLKVEKTVERNKKHEWRGTKAYTAWGGAKDRCYNQNDVRYPLYGGRGIKMFAAWKDDPAAFCEYVSKLEHFGEQGYSLDRIDNNKGYEPCNLHFVTMKTQCRNRRTNIFVKYNGETMILKDAAEKSGVEYHTLHQRYKRGDRGERLFRPVEEKYRPVA